MASRYFVGNAQPEQHSNVEDFHLQIYFETVDTAANCIVECFIQKDYTMYANCEQVLLKGTLGNLSHKMSTNCVSSMQSLTLIHYKFSYLYWQSPITEGIIYCIMSLISSKKKKKIWSLIPDRGHVLVKIILVTSAANASSECSFRAVRRVKSYLCTTMSNNCSNHLMA